MVDRSSSFPNIRSAFSSMTFSASPTFDANQVLVLEETESSTQEDTLSVPAPLCETNNSTRHDAAQTATISILILGSATGKTTRKCLYEFFKNKNSSASSSLAILVYLFCEDMSCLTMDAVACCEEVIQGDVTNQADISRAIEISQPNHIVFLWNDKSKSNQHQQSKEDIAVVESLATAWERFSGQQEEPRQPQVWMVNDPRELGSDSGSKPTKGRRRRWLFQKKRPGKESRPSSVTKTTRISMNELTSCLDACMKYHPEMRAYTTVVNAQQQQHASTKHSKQGAKSGSILRSLRSMRITSGTAVAPQE